MEPVNELTKDCFNAISQLRDLEVGGQLSPERVHERLRGFLDALLQRAPQLGVGEKESREMAYALVALADEVAIGKPEPFRTFWLGAPLQLHYFHESVAGEGFFNRLQALRTDRRRLDVLRVYYLCLAFGFQGKYAARGGDLQLMRIMEDLQKDIERELEPPETLSPAALPPEEQLGRRGDGRRGLWISLGAFAAAITFYVSLRLILDGEVTEAIKQMGLAG